MAWRPDAFRPQDEFLADMDLMLTELRSAKPIDGQLRVYVPGDLEAEAADFRREHGIPLHPVVADELRELARAAGISAPF